MEQTHGNLFFEDLSRLTIAYIFVWNVDFGKFMKKYKH